jgi:hypothetical protein
MTKREKLDPYWHKARIAARIWMKAKQGKPLSVRDRRLAGLFGNEKGVSSRLIQQAVLAFLGGPYRRVQTRDGELRVLDVLNNDHALSDVLGRQN